MENARLKRILTIVDTALSLEPKRRPGYLTDVCGDDEALRKEVEKLLGSIDTSEQFWDDWQDWNSRQIQQLIQEPGRYVSEAGQIGPWRLIQPLGRGGMGSVHLAERADGQYEQQAAVKLLQRGLEAGESARRFEQERQILAKLDHPNIAGLYDGGITEGGRPWLAMQYIDGAPITEWCRRHNCSLQQRLSLFQKVCGAVQYAHRNLVVHRDLKPDNILVTEDAAVKVLDFGIAKLLDEEFSESGRIQTQTGLRVMSLDYAAPEQITGETITTATDVYALGLLLYELLTDTYPFKLVGLNHRKIEQVLQNEDPPRPGIAAVPWQAELRGDLDAIVLKALRKEPDRRYENAGQLLEDIRKYQSNLPVSAQRDTNRYRMGKFYKRHRGKLAAAAVVLISISGLVTYYTIQLRDYTVQLTEEKNQAQVQAKKAEQVSEFLTGLFKASDPGEALGEEITAGELLKRGSQKIEGSLGDEPEVKASVLEVLGSVYNNMGHYPKAESLYIQSLKLRRETIAPIHPDIAKNLNKLGVAQLNRGQRERAKTMFDEALKIFRQIPQPDPENQASTFTNLAAIHLQKNNLDSAEVMLRQAIDLRRKNSETDSIKLAGSMDGLAVTLERKGKHIDAERLYREALRLREEKLEPNHPDVARSLNNLAGFMYRKGDLENAESLYRQVLEMWSKVLGNDHPDVARALNNLAATLEKQGKPEAAEPLHRKALAVKRKALGNDHISTAYSLSNLGLLLLARGDYDASEPLLKESLEIRRKIFSTLHPAVALGLENIAALHEQKKEYPEAASLYRRALDMRLRIQPVDTLRIARTRMSLGFSLAAIQAFGEAETMLLESYAELQNLKQVPTGDIQFLLQRLADLYTNWEKPKQAERYQALLKQ